MVGIDNIQSASIQNRNSAAQSDVGQQTGSWHGQNITVRQNPTSMLADAAEELTFAASEKEESKNIQERTVQQAASRQIPTVEKINEYLQAASENLNQGKLEQLVAKLRAGATPYEAASEFGDITDQYAALASAYHKLEAEGGFEDVLENIHDALEELDDDFGPDIRAGFNIASTASLFGNGDSARTQSFRDCYRGLIAEGQTLAQSFSDICERFGRDDLPNVVEKLLRAVGDDLGSQGPSSDPVLLKSLIDELYAAEVIVTGLDHCDMVVDSMERRFDCQSIDAVGVMQGLLDIAASSWTSKDAFNRLVDSAGISDTEAQIGFLQEIKTVVREMPLRAFADQEAKEKVVMALQQGLDDVIEREEDELL
ncbi:type III secretion system gatekeeper subunit SctW [Thalassospira lucentensis]|uniref:type III secretion system gatekeeper subunit SctW n=1 Tax=Thalassospira lucentensis TaxID=168935 RepID=UPI00142E8F7B|nr:type III secretion system gatekeeper subunit SctW [Thalassospira lucentensis]NIZ03780.1 type III secretion system gatekeeper subunit SctW [Thalassospira lucentensis]